MNSISEDFLERRFDPRERERFEKKVVEHHVQSVSSEIPLYFFGNITEKLHQWIIQFIKKILLLGDQLQFNLRKQFLTIEFYTLDSWNQKYKVALTTKTNLPASKIKKESTKYTFQKYTLQIILAKHVFQTDSILNTSRLICSNLYGEFFFEKYVPFRLPYSKYLKEENNIEFSLIEKVTLFRLIHQPTLELKNIWKQLAFKNGIQHKNAWKIGETQFYQNVTSENPAPNLITVLENWFIEIQDQFKKDHSLLTNVHTKILSIIPQTQFILPHEITSFTHLKNKNSWIFFHALEERLKIVCGYGEQLLEFKKWFQEQNSPFSDSEIQNWKRVFKNIMFQLQKQKLVYIPLIKNARLTEKQNLEKKQFPLWLVYYVIPKIEKPIKNLQKEVSQLEIVYTNSIYQKLFEGSQRIILFLDRIHENIQIDTKVDLQWKTLTSIFAWFEARQTCLEDLLISSQLIPYFLKQPKNKSKKIKHTIQCFKKAWNYFISFAFMHYYYLHIVKIKKNDFKIKVTEFQNSILNYVKQQRDNSQIYYIVEFLIKTYEISKYQLDLFQRLITKESPILDQFILQADYSSNPSVSNKNKVLAEKLVAWLENLPERDIDKKQNDLYKLT